MKSRFLCLLAGLCFLFVFACDSNKTGPPKTFQEVDPDAKMKELPQPPKPSKPPDIGGKGAEGP
jgi:hypothetical protein